MYSAVLAVHMFFFIFLNEVKKGFVQFVALSYLFIERLYNMEQCQSVTISSHRPQASFCVTFRCKNKKKRLLPVA